jgi:hypothetical protein
LPMVRAPGNSPAKTCIGMMWCVIHWYTPSNVYSLRRLLSMASSSARPSQCGPNSTANQQTPLLTFSTQWSRH